MSLNIFGTQEQCEVAALDAENIDSYLDAAAAEMKNTLKKPFSYFLQNVPYCSACH